MANELGAVPLWGWVLIGVWAAYQGARGAVEHQTRSGTDYPGWRGWMMLYVHDFAFRFVCTVGGFAALVVAQSIQPEDGASIAAGVALGLVGLLGVGGQLHYMLLLGKWPK